MRMFWYCSILRRFDRPFLTDPKKLFKDRLLIAKRFSLPKSLLIGGTYFVYVV